MIIVTKLFPTIFSKELFYKFFIAIEDYLYITVSNFPWFRSEFLHFGFIKPDKILSYPIKGISKWFSPILIPAFIASGIATARSEERRVGKECRSRWTAYRRTRK